MAWEPNVDQSVALCSLNKVVVNCQTHFKFPVLSQGDLVSAEWLLQVFPSVGPVVLHLLLASCIHVGLSDLTGTIGVETWVVGGIVGGI